MLGQVVFVGRRGRQQLRYLYSAADVFVTTPWYEPFGITAVEAMACAVPVIGSAVGGLQSTIVDGQTGYLVEPDNADALAARLAQIALDPSARNILGEAGRQRANHLFTWSSVCRRLSEVYERALSAPRLAPLTAPTPLAEVPLPVLLAARGASPPGEALHGGRALAARLSASAFSRTCG